MGGGVNRPLLRHVPLLHHTTALVAQEIRDSNWLFNTRDVHSEVEPAVVIIKARGNQLECETRGVIFGERINTVLFAGENIGVALNIVVVNVVFKGFPGVLF